MIKTKSIPQSKATKENEREENKVSMKKYLSDSLCFMILILLPNVSLPHDDQSKEHNQPAPHGGQFIFKLSSDYRGEVVIANHEIDIYLLDRNMGTILPQGKSGTITLIVPDNAPQKYILIPTETFFKTNFTSENLDQFIAIITIDIEGRSYQSRFEWKKNMIDAKIKAPEFNENSKNRK